MGNAQNKPVKEKKSKKEKSDRKSKQTASIDVTETKEEKPTAPVVKEIISTETTINFTFEDTKPKSSDPNEYVIGGYKVLRTLGKGSFGEVYLVILKEDEKNPNTTQYALKKMFSPDTQSAQAPIQEAEILKTLKHINVVQYNDLFVHFEEGSAFMCLVMEFVEGGTLTEFATQSWEDNSKWNTEVIIRWLFKLLEGIEYVHSMKVVHRDLKPDNLFITFDKKSNELQLKIADFGVSTSNVSKKGQPDISGTPVFMAPEQITYGMFDIKVDMWAIGVILYQVALKLVAIPFIMAQETMDNRQRHINTIEDPSIRYLATMLLKHKSDHRPTAQSLLSHPLIQAWKHLLFSTKRNEKEDLVSTLAYISGLTSATEEVAEKAFNCLKSIPIESLVQVVKEYKCSGPLLTYLTLEKPQNRKDVVFNLLYQFSEQDVMNKAALRNENAVHTLFQLYKTSKNKQILQLISSMCKSNLRNQKLFERAGMLSIVREYVKNNFQVEPQLCGQLVSSFVNLNDAEIVDSVKDIISKSPELVLLFSTMRNAQAVLRSSLFPALLGLLPSHRDALTLLRYLLVDVKPAMIGTYEKGYCSGDITKCNAYTQESWQCTTCWPKSSSALCLFCAKSCHKGHTLVYTEEKPFSCDCYFFNCTIRKDRGNTPEFLTLSTEANTYDSVTFPRKEDSTVNEISPLVFQPTNDITYSIQSDKPLSADGIGSINSTVAYFEMTVTKSNKGPSEVFLGLAPEFYPTNSFPGEVSGTVGYYGYTGKRYCGETDGDFYGPKFGEGDTVGVGITNHGDVYFTRNGLYLGTATTIKKNTNYFITIAFRSKEIQVECNYKNTFVFAFEKKDYETKRSKDLQVDKKALEAIYKKCGDDNKRDRIAAMVTLKEAIDETNVEDVKELMQDEDPVSQLQAKIDKLIEEETAKSKTELEQIKKESHKGKGFQDLDLDVKTIVKAKEPEAPAKLSPSVTPAAVESPKPAKKQDDDLDFLMNPVSIPMPKLAPIAKVEATSTPLPPIVATPTQDEVKLAEQLSEIDKLLKFE